MSLRCAGGGARTHTLSRVLDFESSGSGQFRHAGAPCRSAVPASKRTYGISEGKTRRTDIREVFAQNRFVDFHGPADRSDATDRLDRYALADSESTEVQSFGYFSRSKEFGNFAPHSSTICQKYLLYG